MYKLLLFLFIIGCSFPYIPPLSGDCIDRAITIRQSLREQGYEAMLFIGTLSNGRGHAWVEYKDKESGKWIKVRNYYGRP